MKVTAFIRKTSAKNNVTDMARVYFRVRDNGGVDIKAARELSINPNHWSAEKQGYKPRVTLVSEEKRMNFDRDIQQITSTQGAATRQRNTCCHTRYRNILTRLRLHTTA